MESGQATMAVRRWLETVVIDLNLCPFAKRELIADAIRFVESSARDEAELVEDLVIELQRLLSNDELATTLLIHPLVLNDFAEYNDFLDYADNVLLEMQLDGEIQIASFHPDYQFADTNIGDAENFSNRSPFPMLHLLRESSVARAVASHPDTAQIPADNIARLKQLGSDLLEQKLAKCLDR